MTVGPTANLTFQSPEVRRCPYPYYAMLRDEQPVYQVPGRQDYIISRHADITWALSHPEIFSSKRHYLMTKVPELQTIASEQRCPYMPAITDADPPEHTIYREIAIRAFTPRRLKGYVPAIERAMREQLDRFESNGQVEFVSEFCDVVPMAVIVDILGLPRDMMPTFKRWSDDWTELASEYLSHDRAVECQRSAVVFNNYLTEAIEERMSAPGEDVISELIQTTKDDGTRLNLTELTNVVRVLLIAGNETTAFLLANTMLLFLRNPDQQELVRRDRSLLPRALEESLRMETPSQFSMRTCTKDTVMHGVNIPAGARVLLLRAAANRDPDVFQQADGFDVRRANVKSHLGFGKGIHFCLGAPLSRLEGEIAFNLLFDRLADLVAVDDLHNFEAISSPSFRAPRQLHLRFRPLVLD